MKRLAVIAVAGIVLAGCGGSHASSSPPRQHYPVVIRPPVVLPTPRLRGDLPRLLSPTRLAIVTTGSSSCPSVPDELTYVDRHTLRLHLTVGSWTHGGIVARPPPSGICTADLGPTTMAVAIDPKLIDVHSALTVRVYANGSETPGVYPIAPLPG